MHNVNGTLLKHCLKTNPVGRGAGVNVKNKKNFSENMLKQAYVGSIIGSNFGHYEVKKKAAHHMSS